MHELIQTVFLGIIEGITEFLPISSTGHLLIAEHWMGHRSDLFNIGIQAGAILAITLIYRHRILALLTRWQTPANRDYLFKLAASFLMTSVLGFIAVSLGFSLPTAIGPVAWALIIGGIWMIIAEQIARYLPENKSITWTVAIAVGIAQILAGLFPGTSRSAATIFAAMLFGTRHRSAATEFAFLVGIPTMYAATGYQVFHMLRHGENISAQWMQLGVGFVVSAIVAFVAVRWLLGYIRHHTFTVFAIYRLLLGAALLLFAAI